MLQNTKAKKYTYGLKTMTDYKAQILENSFGGLLLKLNGNEIWSKLVGNFNAYNLAAIYGTADLLGLAELENLQLISDLTAVSGRFQYFVSDKKITAIVDYAHTPDALKNVLETINVIRTKNEELITVVGCGGDRDKTKRPKMGHIASELSTKVVLTSDNPRTEDPFRILGQIESGIQHHKAVRIPDRREAISFAIRQADPGDLVLIAGKGNETTQVVGSEKIPFSDQIVTANLLEEIC